MTPWRCVGDRLADDGDIGAGGGVEERRHIHMVGRCGPDS